MKKGLHFSLIVAVSVCVYVLFEREAEAIVARERLFQEDQVLFASQEAREVAKAVMEGKKIAVLKNSISSACKGLVTDNIRKELQKIAELDKQAIQSRLIKCYFSRFRYLWIVE